MFKRLAKFSPLSLLAFLGATLSWASVSLTTGDVASFGGAISQMAVSILDIFVSLAPYLLGFAAVILVLGYIKGWTKLNIGKGKRRR